MSEIRSVVWSSVGKKMITGLTGFMLMGFVTVHLIGNLTLFISDQGHAFNAYGHFLEHAVHGWLIYAFEFGLIAIFLFHIVTTYTVAWTDKRNARPQRYAVSKDAGGKSRKSFFSVTMIYTGALVILFVIVHVKMFKYADHPEVVYDGVAMKNLFAVVVEAFHNLPIMLGYVVIMILLGFHLRHGFWSAFQSMGWNTDRHMNLLQGLARAVSVVLAIGFIVLPLFIYFFVDMPAAGGHS